MTNEKKAWERFKKNIMANGDPLHLKGCAYMTAQQIEKRTATIDLGGIWTSEKEAQADTKAEEILKSDAYKKLVEELGITRVTYEDRENPYYAMHRYMRLTYC